MTLKDWMAKKGFGQEDAARALGISQGHISKLVQRKVKRVSAGLALRIQQRTRGAVTVADLVSHGG